VEGKWSHDTCGVRTDGTLACWGDDSAGQSTPPGGTFTTVSAGGNHACAVRTDGGVVCWGQDTSGQSSVPVGF
jgi:Regulator of chromosome condensation (RCC1) repeat